MRISKSVTDWYLGYNKDVEKEVPKGGLKRLFYLIWNHFGKLLIINIIFFLCCIPVITIPAALCALNRYLIKMYQDGYGFDMTDYWKEFRGQLLKSIPIGVPIGLLLFYGYYLTRMSYEFQNNKQAFIIQAIGIFCMIISVLFANFCFVILACLNLPNRYIIKDALILMICEWKSGLLSLIGSTFFGGISLLLFPYSIVFLLLGYFSLTQLLVCSSIFPAIRRRIIEPYEKQQIA